MKKYGGCHESCVVNLPKFSFSYKFESHENEKRKKSLPQCYGIVLDHLLPPHTQCHLVLEDEQPETAWEVYALLYWWEEKMAKGTIFQQLVSMLCHNKSRSMQAGKWWKGKCIWMALPPQILHDRLPEFYKTFKKIMYLILSIKILCQSNHQSLMHMNDLLEASAWGDEEH